MARDYEMQFRLNAQLGAQFNSAFKQAQSSMQQFQSEYRNLASTARDISGYQRQQTAVENTRSKLEHLQTQYDNIQREMDETGGFSSDLANKQDTIKLKIEQTSRAYQDQVDRLNEYKRRLEEAGVDTADLDRELARLREELKQAKEGFKDAGDGAKDFGDKGKSSLENVASALEAAGIVAGLKKVYDTFAACVEVSADFEESMSNVEAISSASGDEMTALTNRAKDLGATTAYTAQQVSEGMSYMAMAGWKTNDMLDGMDEVLALAAASGEDLATTSDIVTDALTAFGLTAQDTGRFADVLATASSNANTNVAMMGETFKYAAPVAGALGYSIEDVAVVTGLMANSGIKASQAGTTLRNIFNGLLNGVELTGDAIGEVSLTFEDADGTMMDLASSVDTLRTYFNQMTEAERVHNAINIAGQRGYSGLLAILNSTTADYNKLTTAINNSSGAAQKMADIKLDNLNGDITIAKSAFEGLEIAVGEELAPVLRDMYETFAGIANSITQFVKDNPGVVRAIAAVTTGLGVFVVAVTAAKVAQAAFNAIAAMNVYVLLAAAIVGVTAAFIGLTSAFDGASNASVISGRHIEELTVLAREQKSEIEELRAEYEAVCETEGETSANASLLKQKIEEETAAFENSRQTISEYLAERRKVLDQYEETKNSTRNTELALADEYSSITNLITRLQELTAAEEQTVQSKKEIAAIVDILNSKIPTLGLNYNALTGALNISPERLIEIAEAANAAAEAEANYTALQNTIQHVADLESQRNEDKAAYDIAKRNYEYYVNDQYADFSPDYIGNSPAPRSNQEVNPYAHLSSNWQPLSNGKVKNVETGEEIDYSTWQAYGLQAFQDYVVSKANYEESASVYDDAVAERDRLAAELTGYDEANDPSGIGLVISTYTSKLDELTAAYKEAYDAAKESISGQYQMWDSVATASATSVDSVIKNLEGQKDYWDNYNSNIQTLLQYSGSIEGLSEMVASFGDGSQESVNMIAGMAEAAASGDPTKLRNLVTAWQDNKTAQDEAAQSLADLSTGYSDAMDEIGNDIAAAVEGMDLSDQSYDAAVSTINSFIAGASDQLPYVVAAYNAIGQAAVDAVNSKLPSAGSDIPGNATGTGNASAGYSIVGENGPELVLFHGGEQVLNTTRTAQLLGSRGYTVSFAPVYQISGSVNSDELMDVLTAHDEALKEQLLDLLDEVQTDRVRRRYS